jgi:hypothetical protein
MTQIHRCSLRLINGAPGQVEHEQEADRRDDRPRDLHWATGMYVARVFLLGGASATKQQRA